MKKCKKCGSELILAMGTVESFYPDSEGDTYKSFEEISKEEIITEIAVGIYYCKDCDLVESPWIESY